MSTKSHDLRACTTPSCNGSLTLRVQKVETIVAGEIEVGRCMTCDTMPCPRCKGRTFDPTAEKCQHCKAEIRVKVTP